MSRYILLLFLIGSVLILEDGDTIRPDPLFPDRSNIIDRQGAITETIKEDPLFPNERMRIIDRKDGSTKGTIIKDKLFPDRYIIRKGTW